MGIFTYTQKYVQRFALLVFIMRWTGTARLKGI